MKWFFALSEASLGHRDHDWISLIRGAVMSARQNTTLRPHFIYDGAENELTAELRSLGVVVIHHRVTFYDALIAGQVALRRDDLFLAVAAGAFLRVEIPKLELADEFVLYTDCDVMFQRDPPLLMFRPEYFACALQRDRSDPEDMNSGVMVMNLPTLRKDLPAFTESIKRNFVSSGMLDQEAYREYYKGKYDVMPPAYNWKPYWGVSAEAHIVHFHGPKPMSVRKLIANPEYGAPQVWRDLYLQDRHAYRTYLAEWDGYQGTAPGAIGR